MSARPEFCGWPAVAALVRRGVALQPAAQADALKVAMVPAMSEGIARADGPIAALINRCGEGRNHAGMFAALAQAAANARAQLRGDVRLRQHIAQAAADRPAQRRRVLRALTASGHAHAQYRNKRCALRAALARLGNGALDNRRACEAVLDQARARALQADAGWM